MSEGVKVEFGAVDTAAVDIKNGATQLRTILEDMKSQLAAHSANWAGSASESYRDMQLRWDNNLTDLEQLLNALGDTTRTSGEDFQERERRNAAMWQA